MLKVDPGQVGRKGRILIEAAIAADDPVWSDTGIRLGAPLEVRLTVQRANADMVVRGRFSGVAIGECRRCLREVRTALAEEVTLLYRPELDAVEAEAMEVYPLPARAREVNLLPGLREHVILAVPPFPLCSETCAGLCPHCGADLNDGPCDCTVRPDPRWAGLEERGN
jgi:DUF177 domain-containing protein